MRAAFVGKAIFAKASLSYLGSGVPEPTPAWGLMLQRGAEEYASTAPWIAIFSGLAPAQRCPRKADNQHSTTTRLVSPRG